MSWGWRRAAASVVAISVLLGLAADFARPAVRGIVLESHSSPLTEKARTAAFGLLLAGSAALRADGAADGDNKAGDGGLGSVAAASLFGSAFRPLSGEIAPVPSWAVLGGAAILLAAVASRMLHRRPVPPSDVSGGGPVPLLFVGTSRGPLFKQPVIYVNLGPRGYVNGPGGGLDPSRGLQGLLGFPRGPLSREDAWVLPFGEPAP